MPTPFHINVATVFPNMFPGPLNQSLLGKALEKNLWSLNVSDIRDYATQKHQKVDDAPFGGGAGMVLKPDVIDTCLKKNHDTSHALIYLTPKGQPFNQSHAQALSQGKGMTLLCGRYEGVDQRVIDAYKITEVSIGDYILMGGEIAAMVIIESVVRLLKGVVGKEASLTEETFANYLLEYPHYTRPVSWNDWGVPSVLLSGDHQKISLWRKEKSENLTRQRRPDLWEKYCKSKKEYT